MNPEHYPEFDSKSRKLRGFALTFVGGTVFSATSVVTVALSSQWLYLAVSALSLSAVEMIFQAHKSTSFHLQVGSLMGASAALVVEMALVTFLYSAPLAGACAFLTLIGGLVAARGVYDVEAISIPDSFRVQRENVTAERHPGGE